jgi:SAM-dependent methyltransferase
VNAVLREQFGRPSGVVGRLAGLVMAWENRELNELVVDELQLASDETVLEVGCGPGQGVRAAVSDAQMVVGIDPSAVMVAQARRRNQGAIRDGRADVLLASAEHIPFPDGWFDCAFAVNSVQHWESVSAGLIEVRRVLRPEGRLLIVTRGRYAAGSGIDPHRLGVSRGRLEAVMESITASGFADVEMSERHREREKAVLFPARADASRTRRGSAAA